MKYLVSITVYNTFEVEAGNEDDAKSIIRDMTNDEILSDSDFNINYADEVIA